MSSVGSSSARGGFLTLSGQVVKLAVQLVGVVVLARLLSPSDFGLIAMVMVVVNFGELLRDFGIPAAALQAPSLSKQQASNLFWVNTTLGVGLAAVVALSSPLLVAIYDEQRLSVITPALALVLALNGVQAQLQVQLARAMQFRALVLTDLAGPTLGLAAAIVSAVLGAGYWALVLQLVVSSLTILVLRFIATKWIPRPWLRGAGTRSLLTTGGRLGLSQLLTFLSDNVDTLMIGQRWGAVELGLYNRAFQLRSLPMSALTAPLSNIVVPTLRELQAQGREWTRALREIQFVLGFAVVWVYAVTGATAPDLVPAVLGDQWRPVVPLFQALAVGGAFQIFSFVLYWAFLVADGSRALLSSTIVTKPMMVVLVIAGANWGVIGVAMGYTVGLAVSWVFNILWLRLRLDVPTGPFIIDGLGVLTLGAVACIVVTCALTLASDWSSIARILVGVAIGTVTMTLPVLVYRPTRRTVTRAMRFLRKHNES